MDPITGAVVIAGLKYVGKPSADLVKDFLTKILTPTSEAIGQVMAHPIVEWQKKRVERGQGIVMRASALALALGKEPGEVPGRILFKILEHGSVEENNDLAEHWAALLANASTSPESVLPAFATILADLSPIEAKLLDMVHTLTLDLSRLPDSPKNDESIFHRRRALSAGRLMPSLARELGVDVGNVELYCDNLARLGLLAIWAGPNSNAITTGVERTAELTPLGFAFVTACTTNH